MAITITQFNGSNITNPNLVLGYDASLPSRNVIHDVMDRADPDVTLREAGSRSGELALFYSNRAAAWDSVAMHKAANVFQFADSDISQMAMKYVVDGDISIALDEQSRLYWLVTIPFREVF